MRIETPARKRPGPSLTPLIDVVFILLIFFMLVTRLVDWGRIDVVVSDAGNGAATAAEETVAVVRITPEALLWNGRAFEGPAAVADALAPAVAAGSVTAVYLEPVPEARLQQLVAVLETLRGAGLPGVRLLNTEGTAD